MRNLFLFGIVISISSVFYSTGVLADKPHVLIIMVDDMGYGDPGCYNAQSKIPTPNIDRLATAGMRFTDAHAPGPLCHLSRYGLMTGELPFRASTGQWRKKPSIREDQITIASLLKDNGYQTAMVGKWHLGFDESGGYDSALTGGPVDRGFHSFFGIRASTDIPPYFYIRGDQAVAPPTDNLPANNTEGWTRIQGKFWRAGGIAPGLKLEDVLPRFTEEAVEVIQKHSESGDPKPLMLYLALPAPHTPWLPTKEFVGSSKVSLYGDFTVMVDAMIGKVLLTLDDAGMTEDTLVVFTSDNGPVWYENDVQNFSHDSSGGLRGMKADAWEAGHRMPFIVRWPRVVKAGSTSKQMICFTDLLQTLAEMVEVKLPSDAGPDSVSFYPVLTGDQPEDQPVRDQLVIAAGSGMKMIRMGDWKLIEGLGSGGFSNPKKQQPGENDPEGQLYNLATDIGETHNVYRDYRDVVQRLKTKLKEVVGQ